jgi:TetR/AcrR family transcriptional regulator
MKTRDKIINAALPVFAKKGRHGAHMEAIAAHAHINKAMIYYIFHSKDELYFELLKFVLEKAFESFTKITNEDIKKCNNYKALLAKYINIQIEFFQENRDYTKILVDAISNGSKEIPLIVNYLKNIHKNNDPIYLLKELINKGIAEKAIRDIDTDQLVISIIGMIQIYFFSNSLSETLDIQIKDESAFIESRRNSIVDLVLNGIINN